MDGEPLPIKQLKGEEPKETINLSNKGLGSLSAIMIASLISSNTVIKTLKCAAMPRTAHLASMPTDASWCIAEHVPCLLCNLLVLQPASFAACSLLKLLSFEVLVAQRLLCDALAL
jgi:hypothetical protein